jgi:hypothetical protein
MISIMYLVIFFIYTATTNLLHVTNVAKDVLPSLTLVHMQKDMHGAASCLLAIIGIGEPLQSLSTCSSS